ncbi:MAG: PEGA domain-containing protein [Phycisphaerae bacterium]|nr:PEGA domain-containing protein [Phycisphaerae bacterium]
MNKVSSKFHVVAFLLALAMVIPLSGCNTLASAIARSRVTTSQSDVRDHHVQVISDPPGARIEVNNDYVGEAPLTIKMRGLNGRVAEAYIVRALPVEYGWVQTKLFQHWEYIESDSIPKRIFFDMLLKPRADIEVDIRQPR